jgi:hypothetical protein
MVVVVESSAARPPRDGVCDVEGDDDGDGCA